VILDRYPVKSILNIRSGLLPGPWKKKLLTINGQKISLDAIEHGILRKFWNEPRVHYAVNCASIGCPNLSVRPWSTTSLDNDLTLAATAYINHPRGIRIENGKLIVSSIYKWFKEDFGTSDKNILAHIRTYASPELVSALQDFDDIDKFKYSWKLNAPNKDKK
jgi:hypothetical protein